MYLYITISREFGEVLGLLELPKRLPRRIHHVPKPGNLHIRLSLILTLKYDPKHFVASGHKQHPGLRSHLNLPSVVGRKRCVLRVRAARAHWGLGLVHHLIHHYLNVVHEPHEPQDSAGSALVAALLFFVGVFEVLAVLAVEHVQVLGLLHEDEAPESALLPLEHAEVAFHDVAFGLYILEGHLEHTA